MLNAWNLPALVGAKGRVFREALNNVSVGGGGGLLDGLELMWWLCRDKRVHCTWIYTHVGITNCPKISKHDETRLCFILFPDHGAISYKTCFLLVSVEIWKWEKTPTFTIGFACMFGGALNMFFWRPKTVQIALFLSLCIRHKNMVNTRVIGF